MSELLGKNARVFIGSSKVFMNAEPAAVLSGKVYRITDAAKRVVDDGSAFTISDADGIVALSNIERIDYLVGEVEFAAAYTVSGSVTVSGSYVPMVQVAAAKDMSISISGDAAERTPFGFGTNGNVKTLIQPAGTFALYDTLGSGSAVGAETLLDKADSNDAVPLRLYLDYDAGSFYACKALLQTIDNAGTVTDLFEDSVSFVATSGESATPRKTKWSIFRTWA